MRSLDIDAAAVTSDEVDFLNDGDFRWCVPEGLVHVFRVICRDAGVEKLRFPEMISSFDEDVDGRPREMVRRKLWSDAKKTLASWERSKKDWHDAVSDRLNILFFGDVHDKGKQINPVQLQ